MKITDKELAYLELYKGIEDAFSIIRPDISKDMCWYYATDYHYKQVNSLMTFIYTKDPNLLKELVITDVDGVLDMIFTLSDVACRYAIEKKTMPYHLYRMEHKNNLNNYGMGGMMLSLKSTSKSKSEVSVFESNDTVGLSFDCNGFIPYIDVDNIVRTNVFSDEKEILFPPCIGSTITGNKENVYGKEFTNILLNDSFSDTYDSNYKELYDSIKKDFITELHKCSRNGIVSDNLNSYCTVIGSYIYSNLRNMYNKYSKIYTEMYNNDLSK